MNNIKVLDVVLNNGDFVMDRIGNVYDMEIKFQEESFYFNLGFVLFTAKK